MGQEIVESRFRYITSQTVGIGILFWKDLFTAEILGFDMQDLCFQAQDQILRDQDGLTRLQMTADLENAIWIFQQNAGAGSTRIT